VFGVKGGAAGGGYAQVIPMEDINLHFTGDFHAITAANNLLSSLIDNHIKQGNTLDIDIQRVEWKRCVDLNDRALRVIDCALGGEVNGTTRRDGFNITAASEIMAIMCLSPNLKTLKERLADIVIGYNSAGKVLKCGDLDAQNAMAILLKDALQPNLVQTLEGTPALVHLGPFANIAHGCNSIRATQLALSLSDYAVTEAGFGADLGAEKFLDIKCRLMGKTPDCVVIVATTRSLKHNGNGDITLGVKNLEGHIYNLTKQFNLKVVVAINKFVTDTEEELAVIKTCADSLDAACVITECWAKGGLGTVDLASAVVVACDKPAHKLNFIYELSDCPKDKITKVATKIYGAKSVIFSDLATKKLNDVVKNGYGELPVCIARTQYSFSADPKLLGRPTGFDFVVKDAELRAGSGFIVAIAGDILLMPGLSATPAAIKMTIDDDGVIA
jgi:formate--tetrahydrofolate ligase